MTYQTETQISVKFDKAPASVDAVNRILSDRNVSISTVYISDVADTGYFRFTTKDFVKAFDALKDAKFTPTLDEVFSIRLVESKGKLATLTETLVASGVNIDYMYACVVPEVRESRLIMKVSNVRMAAHIIDELRFAA